MAYGVNRDEWSYIPGGIASGTALIRPDLPELKVWAYFWQQTEYVMGGRDRGFLASCHGCRQALEQIALITAFSSRSGWAKKISRFQTEAAFSLLHSHNGFET